MSPVPEPERAVRRAGDAVGALSLAAVLAGFVPGGASPVEVGLDPSWRWAINAMPTPEMRFGDVVFPYGPFGFVLSPTYATGKAFWALAVQWILFALFAAGLWRLLRGRPPGRVLAAALGLIAAQTLGLFLENFWVLCVAVLVLPAALEISRARWPLVGAGALAGFACLTKVSIGLGALGILAAYAAIAARRSPDERRLAGLALAVAGATAALAAALTLGSFARLRLWVSGTAAMASSFAEAMSKNDDVGLAGLVALLVIYLGGAAWLLARRDPDFAGWWIATPAIALAYEHTMSRLDPSHARIFAPFLLAVLALLMLTARSSRALALSAAGFAISLAICGPRAVDDLAAGRLPSPYRVAMGRFRAALHPLDEAERAARRSRSLLASLQLPQEWIGSWRQAGLAVDAVPFLLSELPANDLRWRPNPVLQLYQATDAALDRRVADHFAGERAPERVLVRFQNVEGRHLVWDAPLTWQTLASSYEPDPAASPDRRRFPQPLRRRERPMAWTWTTIEPLRAAAGEWLAVPQRNHAVFAAVDLARTLRGGLASFLLPPPPLWLEVELPSGKVERWRFLRRTAAAGLLVAPLPANRDQMAGLWDAERFPGRCARRIRWLVERRTWTYEANATVVFRVGRLEPLTPPAAPLPAGGAAP
jgi:hypothetical protein